MKAIITGYGRMGRMIEATLQEKGHEVASRIDIDNAEDLNTIGKISDVIIDFSNPSFTDQILAYAQSSSTPLLSGTTNLSGDQMEKFRDVSSSIPVILTSNYSLGVNLFRHVLEQISNVLKDWDVEIIETHHNKKVDAPSGTAKMLLDAVDPEKTCERIYGREGNIGARSDREIGIHAVRGGSIAGEHTVAFFGKDEVLEITHRALSRQIFASGAVAAAEVLVTLPPGFYTMEDILFG